MFTMKLDGEYVYSRTNSEARVFPNVTIYVGDPGYEAAHGKMKNLAIRTIA